MVFGLNWFRMARSLVLDGLSELRSIGLGAFSFRERQSLVIGKNRVAIEIVV